MVTLEHLKTLREEILRRAQQHGAQAVRVFGSVAHGDNDAHSDVDRLVNVRPGRSLLDLSGLLMDLEALLGCRVDVITEKGLRPRLRDRVLREAPAL